PFQRFVQSGRIAYIADGPHSGKLCTIALVDGPETGVPRTPVRFKQLHLTKFRVGLPYTASTRVVRKTWKDSKVEEQWSEGQWSKKIAARQRRAELTDFERFKLGKARQTRNKIITRAYRKFKSQAAGKGKIYGMKKKVKKTAKTGPKKETKGKKSGKPKESKEKK
ncbi:hypothetical protein B566_EDAN001820, partial [Ephemera danica]